MAVKTTIECDQGQTFILPFTLEGQGITDYTGYTVRFMVKTDFSQGNDAALFDQTYPVNAITGEGEVYMTDEQTSLFPVGESKYQAKLMNPFGEVIFTDTNVFVVSDVLIRGATA